MSLTLNDLRVEWTYPQGASELGGQYEGTRSRPATEADLVEILPTIGAVPMYRTSRLANGWAQCDPEDADGWLLIKVDEPS
jgi:hypothetical protein